MKKIVLLVCAVLLCVSSQAFAQEDGAAATSAATYQKKVTILPSTSPLVSGRKNVSGATLGIAGTF